MVKIELIKILFCFFQNLLLWVGDVKQSLNSDDAAKDVSTAEKTFRNPQ